MQTSGFPPPKKFSISTNQCDYCKLFFNQLHFFKRNLLFIKKIIFFLLQVILELNTTEVSHSTSNVGIEVFAEPESTICLRGQKTIASSSSTSTSVSNTFGAVLLSSQATSMYQDVFKQMIQVFSPVSKTWFFQCGQAR